MIALIFATGALLLVGIAFLVVPLIRTPRGTDPGGGDEVATLYRQQLSELERDRQIGLLSTDQYEPAVAELKRRMLADVRSRAAGKPESGAAGRLPRWALPAVLGAAMPVAAVSLYLQLGAPQAVEPPATPAQFTAEDVEAMVERLAARMKETPEDLRGWTMLGRSYFMLGRYAESAGAYERALALSPNDLDLLTSLAAATRAANPGDSGQRVAELAARALAIDPDHPAALAFAGIAAYDRGEYRAAIARWERLQGLLPPDSDLARTIRDQLSDARSKAGGSR